MTVIKFVNRIAGNQSEIDFSELVTLIKGASLKSMALGDDFFELGLSDAFNLRIEGSVSISLISTLNKGEWPPIRLQIVAHDESSTALTIERRIRYLRQAYAAAFLFNAGRADEVVRMVDANPNIDLEETLLKEEDRLFIAAASEGSFWLTVITTTATAFKSLSNVAPLFYDQGRQALLERVRATTELKKLDVKKKELDLSLQEATGFVELIKKIEKIKDPQVREKMQTIIVSNVLHAQGKEKLLLEMQENVIFGKENTNHVLIQDKSNLA